MDGYTALGKVLTEMTPEQVIQIIKDSGLRGRGGAGFPTGVKWSFASGAARRTRNMSAATPTKATPARSWIVPFWKATPMSVLEAMAIAGYAIGANQGYIYVRAEYPIAVKRLEIAIGQAREYGLLGKNIFGTGFDFDIELRLGAGAFVCGEETALMTSIEGHRGEPRPRPPFPAVKGLFGKPTVFNNVETYANIPQIILNGRRVVRLHGHRKIQGNQGVRAGRQNQQYRPGGSPHGHHPAGNRRGNRRRYPERQEV